jgi:hypothetical protein
MTSKGQKIGIFKHSHCDCGTSLSRSTWVSKDKAICDVCKRDTTKLLTDKRKI